jgi:N6-adenosine-specific RNA methylase IME4
MSVTEELYAPLPSTAGGFATVLADPPWRFQNRTGKVAPEHKRLGRYATMSLDDIKALPVAEATAKNAHLYLWVPNALLPEGLAVMQAWGFRYVSNIVWAKRRKDGGPDGAGSGLLLPQRDRATAFRCQRAYAHTRPRTHPGQHDRNAQARAFP